MLISNNRGSAPEPVGAGDAGSNPAPTGQLEDAAEPAGPAAADALASGDAGEPEQPESTSGHAQHAADDGPEVAESNIITKEAEYEEVQRDHGVDAEMPTAGEALLSGETIQLKQHRTADEPITPANAGFKIAVGKKLELLPDREAENEKLLQDMQKGSNTELATIPGGQGINVATDPSTLMQWGIILHASGTFPTVKSPQDAVARILMARSLQIDEIKAMYLLHAIDGKLVLSADLTRYLIDRAGVRYKILENRVYYNNPALRTQQYPEGQGDFRTKIRMKQDSTGKDFTWEVWWSELQPFWSGKNKATWDKFPKPMQLHACMRQCARFYFPAILGGMYDADEVGVQDAHTFAEEVTD